MERTPKTLEEFLQQAQHHAQKAWRAFRRQHPILQRAILYGGAALLVWAGWVYYRKAQTAAMIAATSTPQGVTCYDGELGGPRLQEGLAENGFSKKEINAVLKVLKKAGGPGRRQIGDHYHIVRSTSGDFHHLTLIRELERVVVTRAPDTKEGFKATISTVALQQKNFHSQGKVEHSLWESMSLRVPDEAIQKFTDVFQWTVDFLTETRDGDRFAVVWTELRSPDGRLHDRIIQAALYDGPVSGRNTGIRFDGAYFDENGDALERVFLRAPLSYRRISSSFSTGRWHPILRKRRPHFGIDYAAPYGTPVVSVGEGHVTAVGWEGGFGKRIVICHNPVYTTLYGHLSRYAPGIQPGVHVRQGQLIAYVGATGLATGPHLHFQISKHGSWVNFLKLDLPRARSVAKEQMPRFATLRDSYMSQWGDSSTSGQGR